MRLRFPDPNHVVVHQHPPARLSRQHEFIQLFDRRVSAVPRKLARVVDEYHVTLRRMRKNGFQLLRNRRINHAPSRHPGRIMGVQPKQTRLRYRLHKRRQFRAAVALVYVNVFNRSLGYMRLTVRSATIRILIRRGFRNPDPSHHEWDIADREIQLTKICGQLKSEVEGVARISVTAVITRSTGMASM